LHGRNNLVVCNLSISIQFDGIDPFLYVVFLNYFTKLTNEDFESPHSNKNISFSNSQVSASNNCGIESGRFIIPKKVAPAVWGQMFYNYHYQKSK